MPVKSLPMPNGRNVKFGRKHPVVRHQRLQLSNYIIEGLPAPPATIDYTAKAASALAQMYENDTLGDCVIAAVAHSIGVFTGNAGTDSGGLVLPNSTITSLYSAACGYVPGNENTDQGCDIQTVLQYWQNKSSIGGTHDITGFMDVDPTNINEVQTAIFLFENLVLGLDLPDKWISPFPSASGFTWDVAGAADPDNGHCVPACGYNASEITIATWGMTGFMTNAALADYCAAKNDGECYVVLSQDMLIAAQQLAPNGLDWAQLQADFAALGGVVPVAPPVPVPPTPIPPAPAPVPVPPKPVPTPPVTSTVGSPAWLRANMSRAAFEALQASYDSASGRQPPHR